MKVLLVEDEKLISHAVKQVLKKNNYLVDLAFDGQEGLDNALTWNVETQVSLLRKNYVKSRVI